MAYRFQTGIVLKLTILLAGVFLVTGLMFAVIGFLYPGREAHALLFIAAGIAVFALCLFAVRFILIMYIQQPLTRLADTAFRIAEEKPYETIAEAAGDDEIGCLARGVAKTADTIECKRHEIAQEHSEYQNLFETVPCLITVQDKNLRLVRYNREFAQKFDPRKGDYCYSVYKGRTEKCENCPVEKTFKDGMSHTFEEAGYNRDGKPIRWVARTAPIWDENGTVVAAMEMSLDVTIKRELEEQLEASRHRYQAIFSNIPNPVFVLHPESMEILDCNDSVEPVYGYTREEILGKSFWMFFESGGRKEYEARIQNGAFLHQIRQKDKNGSPLFVDIRSSRTEYPEWEVLLVTTSDITQQLETEQQLIQASKMTTLGEMATGIAHELNQPLSVMKTASSFMLQKFESGGEVKKDILSNMLAKIDTNVDRATNIISHMRQFARKSELDLESVNVNHVLALASEIFSEQMKVRGILVNWNLADDLPLIRANPSRLEQVFVNVLINARDAIEERWGDLRVDPEDKAISIATNAGDGQVSVAICDSGNGIDESVMDKIFEPFFTTKSVGSGTGLGLSISYGIIRECGGTIQAFNSQSGGACFTMRFPVYDNQQQENANGKESHGGG